MFRLQQFSIAQDNCAMKVCTDSLLFGALAPIKPKASVIDIGAGSALLSLMCMQRGAANVCAVEIDGAAAKQAQDNSDRSPWQHSITVVHSDILTYDSEQRFDVVISNPPFFANHLKSPDRARHLARHTDRLSYEQLLRRAGELVEKDGVIFLLLPLHCVDEIVTEASRWDLKLSAQTNFIGQLGKSAKVCALTFRPAKMLNVEETLPKVEHLVIFSGHQQYTGASAQLLKHFLLRFADAQ